ncbi:MAG: helix-turn-helix domain-containing protein, partial [Pseudomonadota bacterium]
MTKAADAKPKRQRLAFEDRRRDFIEKAIAYFAEEGFESSTRELARRLGVTQPLLYRYFPSKDDLIAEVYTTVYINRWREEWGVLLRDRNQPLRARLDAFYHAYTDVVFQSDWMRIFLFSGLKGVDINLRYLELVRDRILVPIVEEVNADAGHTDRTATEPQLETAWVMHGGIFYSGVRSVIYDAAPIENKSFVIRTSLDAFLPQIRAAR